MPSLRLEGVPPFAFAGGSVDGTLVLEIDRPARARDLTLSFSGREIGQVTVSAGKSTERLVQTADLLSQTIELGQTLGFVDPEHVAPGTYRSPFRFVVPAGATPSIATGAYAGPRGLFSSRPDGLYVEYSLVARLDVPWWTDSVTTTPLPVYSPRRVLGVAPPLVSQPNPGHPAISVVPADPAPLVPGTAARFSYRVDNPGGKRLRSLSLRVERLVEYVVRGYSRRVVGPAFDASAPLGGRLPAYAGELSLTVPNEADATGPWQGQLFRTYWSVRATLDVELGLDVVVEGPLAPA